MARDLEGNNIEAVEVHITGHVAIAFIRDSNRLTKEQLGDKALTLPGGYTKLGLLTNDGGLQDANDTSGDTIDFWQSGYTIGSTDYTSTVTFTVAQNDFAIRELVNGVAPDEHGVIAYSPARVKPAVLLYTEDIYANGDIERHWGVARLTNVERAQSEKGSVRGYNLTFTYQEHSWTDNSKFLEAVIYGESAASLLTISSIAPVNSGDTMHAGVSVKVTGTALDTTFELRLDQEGSTPPYSKTLTTFTVVSPTELTFTLPADLPTTGFIDFYVSSASADSNTLQFEVVQP